MVGAAGTGLQPVPGSPGGRARGRVRGPPRGGRGRGARAVRPSVKRPGRHGRTRPRVPGISRRPRRSAPSAGATAAGRVHRAHYRPLPRRPAGRVKLGVAHHARRAVAAAERAGQGDGKGQHEAGHGAASPGGSNLEPPGQNVSSRSRRALGRGLTGTLHEVFKAAGLSLGADVQDGPLGCHQLPHALHQIPRHLGPAGEP